MSPFGNTFQSTKKISQKESIPKRWREKSLGSIGERDPWNFVNETEGGGFEFVHVPSRIQRDSMGKKKKEKEREGGGKRKTVIGESEARGKRMGFNIASSTEPGDSYNGGARGLAKPYRLWVRDSTE